MGVDCGIEGGSLALTSDVVCVFNMGGVRRRECEHWVVECEDERKGKGLARTTLSVHFWFTHPQKNS